jgi:hypothetical protein
MISSAAASHGRKAIIAISIGAPICSYVAFSRHDERELPKQEVDSARKAITQLSSDAPHEHMGNIQRLGATVIRGSLSSQEVIDWKKTLEQAFLNPKEKTVLVKGRFHCEISKRSEYHSNFSNVGGEVNGKKDAANESILPQLAEMYFSQFGITRYKLTQLQFLDAKSGSENQIWHRDNMAPGLTVLVALGDVTDNGPTELLLESHRQESSWSTLKRIFTSKWQRKRDDEDISSCQPLLACLNTGDAILYDSRLLHRGRGYTASSSLVKRPVLVLRWDACNTPPPGAALIVTTANAYFGSLLAATMFALSKITTRK